MIDKIEFTVKNLISWGRTDTMKFYEKRGNRESYIIETKYDTNIGSLKMKSL